MNLVEPAIFRHLEDEGVDASVYIGHADVNSKYPIVLIRRIDTETIHTKDKSSQAEEILIQITSASKESLLLANDLDEEVVSIMSSLEDRTFQLSPSQYITIKAITRENNAYVYDEVNQVYNIHTDFLVNI